MIEAKKSVLFWEDGICSRLVLPDQGALFQVTSLPGWSKDLRVEVAEREVVSQTRSVALRVLADRTGLTAGLSSALTRRGFAPVHDRGRILTDTR